MVRHTRSSSLLVPFAAGAQIKILTRNSNRVLYSIENQDAANSIYVSPHSNVTNLLGPASYLGQEIISGGFLSDDVDQGDVWCIADVANVRIVVQETIEYVPAKGKKWEAPASAPPKDNPRIDERVGARQTGKRFRRRV